VIKSKRLPLYQGSTQTLIPIHYLMPYHLAYYHLHCARKDLRNTVNTDTTKVASLSCKGESDLGPRVPGWNGQAKCTMTKGHFYKNRKFCF
jgi:hypothetical protein